jgi:hypothetical protein
VLSHTALYISSWCNTSIWFVNNQTSGLPITGGVIVWRSRAVGNRKKASAETVAREAKGRPTIYSTTPLWVNFVMTATDCDRSPPFNDPPQRRSSFLCYLMEII